ncbi:MAG: tyrosine-type recombinase/integrase [Clostridia bacterium]|nr:tyrosine-type recombinase/integrase [Clostridia bacterium]
MAQSTTAKNKYLRDYLKDLPDFVFSYIEEYYNGESVNTKLAYSLDIKVFFDFLRAECYPEIKKNEDFTVSHMDKVTPVLLIHFKSYLREYEVTYTSPRGRPVKRVLRNSAFGINRKLSAVRGLFIYLYKTEQISQNVTDKVDFMKLHQKIKKPLTTQETVSLIDVLYNGENYFEGRHLAEYNRRRLRDIALFITYLGTGVRVSELVSLNVGDIDFGADETSGSFIVTRKGGDQQEIFMPPQVYEAMKEYIDSINAKDTDPLFLNRSGERIKVGGVEKTLKNYCAAVGITHPDKTRPHALRRTFACQLLADGVDIKMVAELMGHKNIEVTHRYYAQYSQQQRREVMQEHKVFEVDE